MQTVTLFYLAVAHPGSDEIQRYRRNFDADGRATAWLLNYGSYRPRVAECEFPFPWRQAPDETGHPDPFGSPRNGGHETRASDAPLHR
jgi:hypothetical protein